MAESIYLIVGALLSGLTGYTFSKWESRQERTSTRRAWGAILYSQIYTQSPSKYLTSAEVPTVRLLDYSALEHLLSSGALDPNKESDLIDFFIYFQNIVNDFNYKADTYNQAWASGVDKALLHKCFRDVQMSSIDYDRNQPRALDQIQRVYKPGDNHVYIRQEQIAAHYSEANPLDSAEK